MRGTKQAVRGVEVAADRARKSDANLDCCYYDGDPPSSWNVVRTIEGQERSVAERLAARRFGTYIPMIRDDAGKPVPLLPGYVLVFCQRIMLQWSRMRDVPGIEHVICYADGGAPIVLTDEEVKHLQAIEFSSELPHLKVGYWAFVRRKNRTVKRWVERSIADAIGPKEELVVRTWSVNADGDRMVDNDQTVSQLQRALGIRDEEDR